MDQIIVASSHNLLRRIPTHLPNYIKPDGTISSFAYSPKRGDDGLSTDLEHLSNYEKATLGDRRFRLLRINVGVIREIINDGLDVIHNPLPDNDAHCLITGNITRGKQKDLLKHSEEYVN